VRRAFASKDAGSPVRLQTRRAAHRKCAVFLMDKDVPYKNPKGNQNGGLALIGEAPFLLVIFSLGAIKEK
jgi:hypothetical protein